MSVSITSNSTPSAQAMAWNGSTFEATWTHTTSSGDNQLVVVLTGSQDAPDTVLWNGVACTQRVNRTDTASGGVHIWDLDNPGIGAYNLVVRRSGNRTYNVCIIALSGVDVSGTPRGTAGTGTGNSGTATASCTAVVGDLILGAASTVNAATPNGGQSTLIDDSSGGGENMQIGYKTATGTTESLTWTQTSAYWAVGVIAYKPTGSSSLTDVDSDETITTGQVSVAYTGTGLTNADGLLVKSGTKSAAATSFSATNATSGTFKAPGLTATLTAGVKFGSVTFDIQDGGVSLATLAGTFNPESGWTVHNVTDISQAADTGCLYYGQSPAVAVGDQVLFASTTATNAWAVTVDTQGFFTVDSGGAETQDTFTYYVWDATDETWGTVGTVTVNPASSGTDFDPAGLGIVGMLMSRGM